MLARPFLLRTFACVLLLIAGDTASGQTTDSTQKDSAFVLLTNDRVLVGNVERRGSQYFISREDGDEIYLPAMRVRKIGKSLDDLYHFQLADAQERGMGRWIEVGHWALEQGLITQAENQVRLVMERYPDHPEVQSLKSHFEHVRNLPPDASVGIGGINVQQAGFQSPMSSEDPVEVVAAERLEMFASQVQPVLVNLCRRCHQDGDLAGGNRANAWAIDFVAGGRGISSDGSTANLIATDHWMAKQSDPKSFLLMATSAHGGLSEPPILPRHRDAIAWLEHFCQSRAAGSGDEGSTQRDTSSELNPVVHGTDAPLQIASVPPELASINVDTPSTTRSQGTSVESPNNNDTSRIPRRVAPVTNPHDPDIFNRM
jgi:hypothetical protein